MRSSFSCSFLSHGCNKTKGAGGVDAAVVAEEKLGEEEYNRRVQALQQKKAELEQRKSELFQVRGRGEREAFVCGAPSFFAADEWLAIEDGAVAAASTTADVWIQSHDGSAATNSATTAGWAVCWIFATTTTGRAGHVQPACHGVHDAGNSVLTTTATTPTATASSASTTTGDGR